MRKLIIVLFLAILAFNTQCGRGGGDGAVSDTTSVTIAFGKVRTGPETIAGMVKGKLNNNVPGDKMALTTVTGRQLTICRITVTGPGMADMVRDIDIAGLEAISDTFNVKSGLNRYFLVELIDNENITLFRADRSGVNLDGRTLKLEVQAEPTDTYLAPPEFSGLSSINNAETRSVRLSWGPATDNLTPQYRLQYEIYISNTSIANREDIHNVFDTIYALGNATVLERDPLMSYIFDANNELEMIAYDYEGALPEDQGVSGLLNTYSPSGRLTPGQPYYFIVKAKDEFGLLDDNFIESSAVTVYVLDIETEGSGTVRAEPAGIYCGSNGSSCIEDYLSGTEVVLTALHDEGGTFLGWSGDECSGTGDCIITLDDSIFVRASFCPTYRYYRDADNDTYGDPDNTKQACAQPLGYITNSTDCNDNNAAINTLANEVCDHADNNCDGQVDEGYDSDGDGYSTCGGDCDDSNALINHGAVEVCDDAIDNDCDGATDEFDTSCQSCTPGATHSCDTGQQGVCATGSETCVITGTWGACVQHVQPSAEICDNLDNDCDGSTDENIVRLTTCGVGECSGNAGGETCTAGTWGNDTCDPYTGSTTEVCDNLDNDCDGSTDENIVRSTTCGLGECSDNEGEETCTAGTWGNNTCDPYAGSTTEVCDNLDNDCDGETDEFVINCDTCVPGATHSCDTGQQGVCAAGTETCGDNGFWGACVQDTLPSEETCSDGIDNDCDGTVDIADTDCMECTPGFIQSCDTGQLGVCAAGTETCGENGIWGACVQDILPSEETCSDGIDNDCDGTVDIEDTDCMECTPGASHTCDTGQQGVCAAGTETCGENGIWGACIQDTLPSEEICSDGIDNDCDGTADIADTDCWACTPGETQSCNTGRLGVCEAGTETCDITGSWGACVQNEQPSTEVCDNLDNNCDGSTDENIVRLTTCGVGECSGNAGVETCTAGTWGNDSCDPYTGATIEVCDNLDNDCDGLTDDNIARSTTCGVGECSDNTGEEICTAGTWGNDTCDPYAGATYEVCDNLDNDCDGQIDDSCSIDITGVWDVKYDWRCRKGKHIDWNINADGTCSSKDDSGTWTISGDQITVYYPGITYVGTVTETSMSGTMSSGYFQGCWSAKKE